ncbi:hypothetical protein Gasu2_33850 [Galdieria sulphuraria]|nr:hypothetical protein Gasu2_33850 [Galdieria sulphuraria]
MSLATVDGKTIFFRDFNIRENKSKILASHWTEQGLLEKSYHLPTSVENIEDCRSFRFRGRTFLIGNNTRRMHIVDIENKSSCYLLKSPFPQRSVEKNWTPLVTDNQQRLLLVYSFDPLLVFQVTDLEKGRCDPYIGFVSNSSSHKECKLRGGTPFLPYQNNENVFVSVAHRQERGYCVSYRGYWAFLDLRSGSVQSSGAPIQIGQFLIVYPTSLFLGSDGKSWLGGHIDDEFCF